MAGRELSTRERIRRIVARAPRELSAEDVWWKMQSLGWGRSGSVVRQVLRGEVRRGNMARRWVGGEYLYRSVPR